MTESEYADACRAALAAEKIAATDRQSARGVWIVQGEDAQGLPFVVGHPEGRAASWDVALRMHKVQGPTAS